jgi:hypothetical protein
MWEFVVVTRLLSLVGRPYRQGIFWLTAVSDADSLLRLINCRLYLLLGLSPHGA